MRKVRSVVGALLLLGVAGAGLRWGPALLPGVERTLGLGVRGDAVPAGSGETAPSPEMAEAALDRFERFRAPDGEARLALGGPELSSLIRYALPGLVPQGVSDPTVRLHDGRVRVSARVAVEAFPKLPRLDEVMGLLPDTVLMEMEGALIPLDQAFLALRIDQLEASGIPIPKRLVAGVLAGLGREGPSSLPADALAVPIPDGVAAAFVQRDSLILEARR